MRVGDLVTASSRLLHHLDGPDIAKGTLMILLHVWAADNWARLVYPVSGHHYDVSINQLTKL